MMRQRYVGVLIVLGMSLVASAQEPAGVIKLGHVGHDHHLALFVAASRGRALADETGGVWLKQVKPREVYDLMTGDKPLTRVLFRKVGGGSGMPAALARGEIEVGLGGVAATVAAIDKGADLKIIAPCNCDGDMVMVRPDFPATSWSSFLAEVRRRTKPVKIGYKAPRAVAYLIFMGALEAEGIRYGPKPVDEKGHSVQVVLVNLQKGSNMVPSLRGRVVDGIVMNQPTVAVAEAKGVGKTIADLRDLPPDGRWRDHPCCCVVATSQALQTKRPVVGALVKAIVAGGRYVLAHRDEAIGIASQWTRQPIDVEKRSVPTVTYITTPDTRWRRGMRIWFEMMNELGQFTGRLKGLKLDQMHECVADYSLVGGIGSGQ